jgi:hypothetical protein
MIAPRPSGPLTWPSATAAALTLAESLAEQREARDMAAIFLLLSAAAWFAADPGVSIALTCYGAALVSGHLYRLWRGSASRRQRSLGLLGLVLAWLVAAALSAAALPSNISAALI